MSHEFPKTNPQQKFEIGQKVKLKKESKVSLEQMDLNIDKDNVLTVTEYYINNDDDNGDTVILRDEKGNESDHIAVWHLDKVLN